MGVLHRRAVAGCEATGAVRLVPTGHPVATLDSIFAAAAQDCDLPLLPESTAHAIAMTRDGRMANESVARAVEEDPALAARVLRLAGSPIFARGHAPATVLDAVRTIGQDATRDLILTASVQALHEQRSDTTTSALWAHAMAVGLATDELAALSGCPRGGAPFIGGLFHDVGKLLFHLAQPDVLARLGAVDSAREIEVFGRSHEVVSAALVYDWGLGRSMAEAIMAHHQRPLQPGLAADIACADWVAYRAGHGGLLQASSEPPDADLAALDAVAARVAAMLASDPDLFR
jgi:putative nucleotidyltransferase with HDIG domain